MIRQTQIDGLIAWFRSEIERLKSELESPVYSFREVDGDYYTDSALPLLERLERAESDKDEAENFEVEEPEFPAKHLYLPIERRAARSIV